MKDPTIGGAVTCTTRSAQRFRLRHVAPEDWRVQPSPDWIFTYDDLINLLRDMRATGAPKADQQIQIEADVTLSADDITDMMATIRDAGNDEYARQHPARWRSRNDDMPEDLEFERNWEAEQRP